MRILKLCLFFLLVYIGSSAGQTQPFDFNKPVTFRDVLRQLLGMPALARPADRIMNTESATKLRDALLAEDSSDLVEVTSAPFKKALSAEMMAGKPSRFDDVSKSDDPETEPEGDKEVDLEKEGAESADSQAEVTKGDVVTRDGDSSTPDKKWRKPSRFDGSYEELMQEWKLKQAAILKMAAADKKETNGESLSARRRFGLTTGEGRHRPNPQQQQQQQQQLENRPNHRQKRFFFSWPGSFESPWPENERTNAFVGSDPTAIQGQQIFRLFSNSFFNGLREFMQGFFRLRPAESAATALSENELKKRTLAARMASRSRKIVTSAPKRKDNKTTTKNYTKIHQSRNSSKPKT